MSGKWEINPSVAAAQSGNGFTIEAGLGCTLARVCFRGPAPGAAPAPEPARDAALAEVRREMAGGDLPAELAKLEARRPNLLRQAEAADAKGRAALARKANPALADLPDLAAALAEWDREIAAAAEAGGQARAALGTAEQHLGNARRRWRARVDEALAKAAEKGRAADLIELAKVAGPLPNRLLARTPPTLAQLRDRAADLFEPPAPQPRRELQPV